VKKNKRGDKMPDIKWIKLLTTMFDDEKIRIIESMPDCDAILIIWIKLLAQAGKSNADGYLLLSQNIPYTDEMLSTIFNRPLNTIRLALEVFKKFGMIEYDHGKIYITNWEKHQNIEGMDLIREQTRARVQRHRDKLKEIKNSNVTCNVTVTQGNAIEEDLEEDIESNNISKDIFVNATSTNEKSNSPVVTPYQEIMELFHSICTTLPRIKNIKGNRQKTIYVWYRQLTGIEDVRLLFEKAHASDFLSGRNDKWKDCCFDWIIKPANRQKILEGNYDNKKKTDDWRNI